MTLRRICLFLLLACPAWSARAFDDCNGNGIPDDQDIANCDPEVEPWCADCVPHNCCEVHYTLGCSDPVIEACVCNADDVCCDEQFGWYWDSTCVGIAESNCGAGACSGNGIPDQCDIEACDPQVNPGCGDCNGNGVPDACDIARGDSFDRCLPNGIPDECENDCNCNGVPDDEDIATGFSADCDEDGVPDECGCPVDLVLVLDTSNSMYLAGSGFIELVLICEAVQDALDELFERHIPARVTVLAMAPLPFEPERYEFCTAVRRKWPLSDYLDAVPGSLFNGTVPGEPPLLCGDALEPPPVYNGDDQENMENWGPASAVVAEYFDWLDGYTRIVIPVSDDGPCIGGASRCDSHPICSPAADQDSIEKAIPVANANAVHVCPIMGILGSAFAEPWEEPARDYLAEYLAEQTGAEAVLLSDFAEPTSAVLGDAFADAITATLARVCSTSCDDCNDNGVPDSQDIAAGTSEDCNADGKPDECEEPAAELTVVVLDEPPAPLEFVVPPDVPFAFDYDPARLTLWDTPSKDNSIPSGQPLTGLPVDPDCGADLADAVEFQVCFTGADGGPIAVGCERFDADVDDDVDASDFEVFRPLLLWPTCAPVTVYAEGLPPRSDVLGDTSITLRLPGQGDEILETRPVTIAEVTVTPASSRLGAPVNITVEPAIYPLAFDCRSTVTFDGRYEPLVGDPTPDFQVAYNADQVCELSGGEAVVKIGDGTMTNAPDPTNLSALGVIRGKFTLTLPGATLTKSSFELAPESQLVAFERVFYPDGPGGLGMPRISGAYQSLPVMMLSTTPDPLSPDESYLKVADGYHVAAVVHLQSPASVTLAYRNVTEIDPYWVSYLEQLSIVDGHWAADDIRLNVAGGCHAIGYEVAVYGGDIGGTFDAHVELFNLYDSLFDFPGDLQCLDYPDPYVPPEGTGIPGTGKTFTDLPGAEAVSYLYVPLDTDLPEQMWVYLSVTSDDAGWILGDGPDIGSEVIPDCYGGHNHLYDCTFCLSGGYSMWTQVYCRDTGGGVCEDVPSTLFVDLVSYDTVGTEIDRASDVTLRLQVEDDYDPDNIVYHNDLDRPIVLVDVDLNKAEYPEVIPLHVVPGGSAVIVRATD